MAVLGQLGTQSRRPLTRERQWWPTVQLWLAFRIRRGCERLDAKAACLSLPGHPHHAPNPDRAQPRYRVHDVGVVRRALLCQADNHREGCPQ